MNNLQYDPYADQQQPTLGSMTKDVLTSPSTYAFPYFYLPSTYSNTKGIWSPVSLKARDWGKAVGRAFPMTDKGRRFSAKGLGQFVHNINPMADHRVYQNNISRIATLKTRKEKYYKILKSTREEMRRLGELKYSSAASENPFIMSSKSFNVSDIESKTKILSRKEEIAKSSINRLSTKIKGRSTLKWAIKGAKAGTVIGATMLAFDLVGAVAQTAGQAALNMFNNIAMDYQQRFMPETGGQLALSYLSRGAATERQRAVQSISRSSLNARSAMGQEASLYY